MHKHHYDLDRFSLGSWDDWDNVDAVMPPGTREIEEAEHILFVRIQTWIEALCQHEVGQERLFAPDHTYASMHQDEVEQNWRQQHWLVLFYETKLLSGDISEATEAEFGLEVRLTLNEKGDVMNHSVMLTSAQPLDEQAEDNLYQRIVTAAEAHAAGSSAIFCFASSLENATASTTLSAALNQLIGSVKHILFRKARS